MRKEKLHKSLEPEMFMSLPFEFFRLCTRNSYTKLLSDCSLATNHPQQKQKTKIKLLATPSTLFSQR